MVTGLAEHPKKEVRKALRRARAAGWSVVKSKDRSSHAWGTAVCPGGTCRVWLSGTPRTPEDLADTIRRNVANCSCTPVRKEES